MSRLSNAVFLLLLVAAILLGSLPAHAQKVAPQPVNITTADGVKLKGAFYPSATADAPTVIMLHPVGEGKSMKLPEWQTLAEALQPKYSVMMFDFRGHGDSTVIDAPQTFWKMPMNANLVRTKNKDAIEVKDYVKNGSAYLPVLVNDIAAVRAYLDQRNDARKDCNTSSIIVIGADAGATLGALWINAEMHRFKITGMNMGFIPQLADKAEGHDIMAAVFLSIQPSLEKRPVKLGSLLRSSCKANGLAAAFFCGKDDSKSFSLAKNLEKELKQKGARYDFIGAVPLMTKLSGIKLLNKGLKTDELILDYLKGVADDRKVDRTDKDFLKTGYVWRPNPLNPRGLISARKTTSTEKTLVFDDYQKFLPQQ